MRARAARAAGVGCLCFFAACSLPWVGLWRERGIGDIGLYGKYGIEMVRGTIPYRGFYIEFPPGALPALAIPAAPQDGRHYIVWFHVFMLLCGLVAVAALAISLAALRAGPLHLYGGVAAAGLAPAALGRITLNSFDLWPTALTMVGVAALLTARPRLALAFLGAATAAKLYPVLLVPPALLWIERARVRGALAAFFAVLAVAFGPFLAGAPGGLRFSLQGQITRGLQFESLGASILEALHRAGAVTVRIATETNPYSIDVAGAGAGAIAAVSTLVVAAAAIWAWRQLWLGPRTRERLVVALAASAVAFLAFGKVLSPQYLIWLAPLVPLVGGEAGLAATALLLVACGLTQVWMPDRFHELERLGPVVWFVLARNLVLVALYALLARRMRTTRTP